MWRGVAQISTEWNGMVQHSIAWCGVKKKLLHPVLHMRQEEAEHKLPTTMKDFDKVYEIPYFLNKMPGPE